MTTSRDLRDLDVSEESVQLLTPLFDRLLPMDIADFIAVQSTLEKQLLVFQALKPEKAVLAFEYLPFKIQKHFMEALPVDYTKTLLNALAPDDRTALLEEFPSHLLNHFLKYLSPEERALSVRLLGYPKNSVGRLMTPDYVTVKLNWSVKEALDYIRQEGRDSETLNVVYAVDDQGVLVDDFRIREFLLNPLDTILETLADHEFVCLEVNEPEGSAVRKFRKYARTALPVIDQKGVLLGIVTFDDIMAVGVEEDTEDIQKIGGVAALREPYMEIPFFTLMRKRLGWLVLLFLGELLTASAMGYYEGEIEKAVVLALFLPLIISSGGNAGSQASTLIVRAMALGEVGIKDWWIIMRREIFSGLFLGVMLGTFGFLRVAVWGSLFASYGEHWMLISVTIFLSLIGVVMWGSLTGSM
ncbi:MAG: magnesium transporter, partial [Parachlamydiaceae bacterium]